MPASQSPTTNIIIMACVSALFVICSGLVGWIANNLNKSIKQLFDKVNKTNEELQFLKGECKERHKKK